MNTKDLELITIDQMIESNQDDPNTHDPTINDWTEASIASTDSSSGGIEQTNTAITILNTSKKSNKITKSESIKLPLNTWKTHTTKVETGLLTSEKIDDCFNNFKKDVLNNLQSNQIIYLQFKVMMLSGQIRSISDVGSYTNRDDNTIINVFQGRWELKAAEYEEVIFTHIIFTYKIPKLSQENQKQLIIKSERIKKDTELKIKLEKEGKTIDASRFKGLTNFLPESMDITKWGQCTFSVDYTKATVKQVKKENYFECLLDENSIKSTYKTSNGVVLLEFEDTLIGKGDLNTFIRTIKDRKNKPTQYYIYIENVLHFKGKELRCNFIQNNEAKIYAVPNKIITMDLETRLIINNKTKTMEPYSLSIYDGTNIKSFYLTDFEDSNSMLEASLNYLMKRKYKGYKVYLHNFSYFDGIFLMKVIAKVFPNVKPIIKDGQLINIKSYYGPQKKSGSYEYSISFRDSFLLLPASLANLAKNMGIETNKGQIILFDLFWTNVWLFVVGKFKKYKIYF